MVYPSSARTHLQAFSPISRSDLTNITKTKTKTKTFTTSNLINFVLFLFLDLRFLLDVLVMQEHLLYYCTSMIVSLLHPLDHLQLARNSLVFRSIAW